MSTRNCNKTVKATPSAWAVEVFIDALRARVSDSQRELDKEHQVMADADQVALDTWKHALDLAENLLMDSKGGAK